MAKSYLQLNNTIATFIDEHNSLVNKVGDLASLVTTGDSDLIQAINEIHNSDSDNNSLIDSADTKLTTAWGLIDSADTKLTTAWGLIDSADTKLSSVQLVADSAQSRIDGLITDRTAFPSDFIPDADGTRNLGADATRWNSSYHDYIRVTNNIRVGDGSAAVPAYAFEGDSNTGLYTPSQNVLSVSAGGVENLRVSGQPRAGTSGNVTESIFIPASSSFTSLEAESFVAQSTGILIIGDVIFYGAGGTMYVYSRVGLVVSSGGAVVAIGNTQIDGLDTTAPFDFVSQSPSLAVTGLTPGVSYTAVIYIARGNVGSLAVPACTATGCVNYVHG